MQSATFDTFSPGRRLVRFTAAAVLTLGAALGIHATAHAGSSGDRLATTIVGAGIGALVGHGIGGEDGAAIGGMIGATVGFTAARGDHRHRGSRHSNSRSETVVHRGHGDRYYYEHPKPRRYYGGQRHYHGPRCGHAGYARPRNWHRHAGYGHRHRGGRWEHSHGYRHGHGGHFKRGHGHKHGHKHGYKHGYKHGHKHGSHGNKIRHVDHGYQKVAHGHKKIRHGDKIRPDDRVRHGDKVRRGHQRRGDKYQRVVSPMQDQDPRFHVKGGRP